MDKKTEFNYFVVLTVLMLMVSIHNLIKSILLYCENNSKTSSVIKIIFNISGIACGILNIGVLLISDSASLSECLTITYLQTISNFAFSESIVIFLVWKLRQFKRSKKDDCILYGLLLMRSLFNIIYIIFIRPQLTFDPVSPDITLCNSDANNHGRLFLLITTINDLLIDAYVAFRFIQYIRRNLKSTTIQNQNEQHFPLSYTLILWNALRISITSIYHINIIILKQPIIGYTIQTIIFIILSYLITFYIGNSENQINDENNLENGDYKGKNVPKSTSNETSISDDDVVLRASNGMLVDMPLKNVRDEIKMEQKYKIEKLDPNGDIGLVKQSLSFYEIASMFLGKDSKRQSY